MNLERTPKRLAILAATTLALTVGAVGGAFALAGDDDAHDRPIPAADLDQAERAALEETGEGRVTETEVDDEESRYEVEVTLDDGTQVDVQLDADFQVVGTESDGRDDESGSGSGDD
ncbi:PepSY domain-containing protein [Nocardioides sp.]|uniref:PepSY domain-containing protein n=1 Tax=Nocardioides sp. TaxID=35761 RepID=UPI002D7E9B80|nr:PepSY domain-containing protein [Nocardioides sp.]HET8961194.1 PepSY domain-containing protein [Nocardioides sp.]